MTATESFRSTCSYCGVGCGVIVNKEASGKVTVQGDPDHPVNKGMLCSKGMNLHYVVSDKSDRILYPEMRWARNLPRQKVSWDTALERTAAVFKTFIEKYGPDSVGFYVSGQCLTEEYYIINKLVKGFLGTNNIDTNSRLCMSSAVVGYKLSLGEDSVPVSYEDIELADCFFITGANPAWCHPILFRRLEAYKAANPDVKIIVADPRKTQTCSIADLHLQINPGTDITLYHAIGRSLIEAGLIDYDFINDRTEGFELYRREVMKLSLEEAAEVCGITIEEIELAAKYIGEAKGYISMWAMGLNQSVVGVNKNLGLINLSLITGQIGKPGSGPFSLTGQPNAMGGREVGGLCNLLPAHRNLDNPAHRAEVAEFWGVPSIPEKPGYSATEMFDNLLSGKLKAIWIICTNPLVSLPNARNIDVAMKNAKFVVVQDISHNSDTVKFADVILPAAGWLEKEGTMTNSERRITYLNKVIDAPGHALPDIEIIQRFAALMGYQKYFNYSSASDIFDEHCRLTKGTNVDISGLSYEKIKQYGSVQWPCPTKEHKGTPRLFTDHKFPTISGKARLHNVPDGNLSEKPTKEYPLILTSGRIRDQWHTMTRTGKVKKLNQHIAQPFLEIHYIDAESRDIKDGDVVEVINSRGSVRVLAKVTEDIKPGVVFLPMHWGRTLNADFARANNLTSDLIDAKSKEPDLKFSAIEVIKYTKENEKILVVGAGAGACRFVTRYRELNKEDELVVFSAETDAFYNRVMLPEYISGKQSWSSLMKLEDEELRKLDVVLHKGVKIVSINREGKTVTDSNGNVHAYDKLLLSMGSRANVPGNIPTDVNGIFTMRSRPDADNLIKFIQPGGKAVIVGGGLLGLELADSLNILGMNVSVVQRSSRLMDRQLDVTGSTLLAQELNGRGIDIYYNDEVLQVRGKEAITGVRLKSGRNIDCDVMIIAIGTIPNTQLAKDSGLICNRGVVVDDYLRTSDPDIFAIGEIAEYNQQLFGITAAAEEQAEKASEFINGNLFSIYKGSLSMNILKVSGLSVCSLGMVEAPMNDPDYEEVIYIDKAQRYYKKCIVYQDNLVGAILIGDKAQFNEFRELIKSRLELSEKRLNLILGSSSSQPAMGKLVCSCNNVGEGNLVKAIENGCSSMNDLCKTTGAGTGCGSCRPEVKALLEKLKEASIKV
ncbi:MAG: molybdopterin-dependent oxidoreductase [Cytophagaceae bacterium]